ncbi:hypothetical protein BASA81_008721 [Batrachochytrium salamandrivorans]|nr:hypothetical protein BASA81_008721 [Batrachochytrium salamandrivorans]
MIAWAHAVNSMRELEEALGSREVNAIEADVGWNSVLQLPVMRHAACSTVALEADECLALDWLERVLAKPNHVKILKLDFKSPVPVAVVIDWLVDKEYEFELFLNADVFVGPGMDPNSSVAPVPAMAFVEQCKRIPTATLSLGWTTSYGMWGDYAYSAQHVDEMLEFIRGFPASTKFTFPIRASVAWESWPELKRLLQARETNSLTLWTAAEGVPQGELDLVQSEHDRLPGNRPLFVDCFKGPRHARWNPVRLVYALQSL